MTFEKLKMFQYEKVSKDNLRQKDVQRNRYRSNMPNLFKLTVKTKELYKLLIEQA